MFAPRWDPAFETRERRITAAGTHKIKINIVSIIFFYEKKYIKNNMYRWTQKRSSRPRVHVPQRRSLPKIVRSSCRTSLIFLAFLFLSASADRYFALLNKSLHFFRFIRVISSFRFCPLLYTHFFVNIFIFIFSTSINLKGSRRFRKSFIFVFLFF